MKESLLIQGRYQGALLGLAAGDAVGTTLEFKPPGTFEPITGMVGGGPFGLEPANQWGSSEPIYYAHPSMLRPLYGARSADAGNRKT